MKYANQIILFFLWKSASFIYCQQTENSTASLSLIHEENIELNTTNIGVDKNQSLPFTKQLKKETEKLDVVHKSKLDLNLTEVSAEKNESVLPAKEFTNETEQSASLNNSFTLGSLIRPMNVIIKSSSMATNDVNYTLESSPSKNVEFRDASETLKGDQHAASSKLMQEIKTLKNSHNISASANNIFKLVVPYIHQDNPRFIRVWKVPHEVLRTNKEGRDIIRPASVIESRSFITNPKISSVRLNLAFPETLANARIESRSPMGYEDGPDYGSGEPYTSNESGEPPESGVYTETSDDTGRFLEDDYRKEIEKEAEAFIKKQKAQNATNNGNPSSAETDNPESMENNYPNSIETEKGPEQTETDSQEGFFGSQGGPGLTETDSQDGFFGSQGGPGLTETDSQDGFFGSHGGPGLTETNSQQGYFTSHNGNKVFFYKGNDNFFNIDDVFPMLKFDQIYNQPLIDEYPEGFYVPQDHTKSFSQTEHSEYPPQFLHTVDTQDNLHTNNEAPDMHSKYHSSVEDSPCTREQENIEQVPESGPGLVNQDYHNSEPNYDTNHQHSEEFEGEGTPPEYQDNRNYKNSFEPHVISSPPEYDDRENYKGHTHESGNPGKGNTQHNSDVPQGGLEYHRKKSQMHQYQMQQEYKVEHHEEKSSLRKNAPKTPYHFHSESNIKNKPKQIQSIENYNHSPHNQKENIKSFNDNKPTQIHNHNFIPPHNSNVIIHNQNKNYHSLQYHNQNIESPTRSQNIVHDNRNNIINPPHNQNQQYVPTSQQNFIPPHIQNPNSHIPHPGNQHFVPHQAQDPNVQSKVNFHSPPTVTKLKPDCHETESPGPQDDRTNQPLYHEQRHFETPQTLALAIARSTNLAMGKSVGNHNIRYPISTIMALASSENKIRETNPSKKSKRLKQKSHIKRSKARRRNGKNRSREQHKKQRKSRRSTRDNMKAEAATYHWGLENHKDKDGFFMYANNPTKDDYEFGYRVGGPRQTMERHHKTEGVRSTIKLNWEDQNGDSGDQYWEFNHGSSEEGMAKEPSLTAKIPQKTLN